MHLLKKTLVLIMTLAVLFFQGCVGPLPIPIYEQPPYWSDPARLQFMHKYLTTKMQVQNWLGVPDVRRADDRVWAYGQAKVRGIIAISGGNETFYAKYLLLIMFDDHGLVLSHRVFEESHGCLVTGLCFSSHWREEGEYELELLGSKRLLLRAIDFFQIEIQAESGKVEQFTAPKDNCCLYIYSSKDSARAVIRLWDSTRNFALSWWTLSGPYFVKIELSPGTYKLTLNTDEDPLASPEQSINSEDELSFGCEEEELLFVRRKYKTLKLRDFDNAQQDLANYLLVSQPSDPGWISVTGAKSNGE